MTTTTGVNTTNTTNSAVNAGQINLSSDYNTFLKLLTTQLQTLVNQSSGAGPAVNLIGKQVQAASPTATMANGAIDWTYELAGDAASAKLSVTDEAGKVVWTQQAPQLGKGQHDFNWDGSTLTGGKATAGTYTLSVTANDSNLQSLGSNVYVQGVVTGVQSSSSGTLLNLGSTTVNYTNVTQVKNTTN